MINSLLPLKKAILSEPSYQIHLITLEPPKTIINSLLTLNLDINVYFLSLKPKIKNDNKINVIINDGKIKYLEFYKNFNFLLIGGKMTELVSFFYMPSDSDIFYYLKTYYVFNKNDMEKINNLENVDKNDQENNLIKKDTEHKKNGNNLENVDKNDQENNLIKKDTEHKKNGNNLENNLNVDKYLKLHIKKYSKNYPLYQLLKILNPIHSLKSPNLTYKESLLIFIISENNKFSDICKNIYKINSDKENQFKNKFEILMVINKLIKFKFLKRRKNNFFLRISLDYANLICERIGFDIKRKIEIEIN